MVMSLSSLVPNVADFLALEPEEAAGVLLAHLNSYGGDGGNSVVQHGMEASTTSSTTCTIVRNTQDVKRK